MRTPFSPTNHVYSGKGARRQGDTDSEMDTVKEKVADRVTGKRAGQIN